MDSKEQLEIEDFLTIKHAVVDVRPFTILIGREATGKSVIAKVLYFFRSLLSDGQFIDSIGRQDSFSRFEERSLERFAEIFPKYAWEDQKFSLTFTTDRWELKLLHTPSFGQNSGLTLCCSEGLIDLFNRAQAEYRRFRATEFVDSHSFDPQTHRDFSEVLRDMISDAGLEAVLNKSVFVPAGRAFFANFQRNIFSFLVKDISLDPLIKEFGSAYETMRPYFNFYPNTGYFNQNEAIRDEVREILNGDYLHAEGEDWIVSEGKRTGLAHASSGQQEAVPLLCVLSALLHRFQGVITLFVEEPEAHLYPPSQRSVVNILSIAARIAGRRANEFILTTHSPYILTALNILILASNISERSPETAENVERIIAPGEPIRFDEVSAYKIESGRLWSIMDHESNLIGDSIIDEVSDTFESVTNELLKLDLSRAS